MTNQLGKPILGPGSLPTHDIVVNDALIAGYRALAAVMADRGRLWTLEHDGALHVLTDDDPMVAAIYHLADALARIQQGMRERVPRAGQHYQAVLLIAGHMAREVPFNTFRRPPGRAA